jgi:hypothetical protein
VAAAVAVHPLPGDMALDRTSTGQALGPHPDHRKAHFPPEVVAADTAADPATLSRPGQCPGHPPGSVVGEAVAKTSADAGAGAAATTVTVVVADRLAVGMVTDERF